MAGNAIYAGSDAAINSAMFESSEVNAYSEIAVTLILYEYVAVSPVIVVERAEPVYLSTQLSILAVPSPSTSSM